MLVSVVMAAYNAEAYVAEAVESVVAQSYDAWELLVVDDGSTDQTAALVRSVGDERIRVLSSTHVGVLAQVRNRGIEAARGDAIALLDADDVWLAEKLARQVAVLRERPEVGLVHTRAAAIAAGGPWDVDAPSGASTFARLLENNFVVSSSVLIRRSVLAEHGAFDPDPVLDGSLDYELWLRLAPRTEFAYLDETLVLYRFHDAQMSARRREMALGALAALERARARDPELVARARFAYRIGVARQRVLAGDAGPLTRLIAALARFR